MTITAKPARASLARCWPLLALLFAAPLSAQQLREARRTYMPPDRDPTRGLAGADVDQDGDVDLFFCNNGVVLGHQNTLVLNDGQGRFTDVTATHLPAEDEPSHTAAFADMDGDGDLDLVVGNEPGRTQVCLNDGTGAFPTVAVPVNDYYQAPPTRG